MKKNFCLLIALCVLHWVESVEAETESVLGYRLIGEGNCASDNSQTKHPVGSTGDSNFCEDARGF